MPVLESYPNLVRSAFLLGYGITLPVFGLPLLGFEFLLYFIFISLDYFSGLTAAKKQKRIYSKIEREGLKEKLYILCLVGTVIVISGGLNSTLGFSSFLIGLIPHFFLGYLISAEIKSILENYSVIFTGTKHSKIFHILNYLAGKMFNLSLDKLKEVTEKKIDEKFNK